MVGKTYYQEMLPIGTTTTQIEVSTFEKGLYIVQVMDKQGKVMIKKILID